jgi:nitrogen fixation NifU-like protein
MPGLYSEVILDRFRQPRNQGTLAAPDVSQEEFNPICGDRVRIELKLNGSMIEEARFIGDGCAISIAAASLLTELVIGFDIKEAAAISDEQLIAALETNLQPTRVQCALLPLIALRKGLELHA